MVTQERLYKVLFTSSVTLQLLQSQIYFSIFSIAFFPDAICLQFIFACTYLRKGDDTDGWTKQAI